VSNTIVVPNGKETISAKILSFVRNATCSSSESLHSGQGQDPKVEKRRYKELNVTAIKFPGAIHWISPGNIPSQVAETVKLLGKKKVRSMRRAVRQGAACCGLCTL
jgi:hypothetical protein